MPPLKIFAKLFSKPKRSGDRARRQSAILTRRQAANNTIMQENLYKNLNKLRQQKPLVHCITNQVTMHLVANSLLALGASPIMSSSVEEVEEVTAKASALYLNIGTLSQTSVRAMLLAGKVANRKGIPVVLDPVGAGFTAMRNQTCATLLNDIKITAIRGNASEIMALSQAGAVGHGVDSRHLVEEAHTHAEWLAQKYDIIIALTGKSDYVTDGNHNLTIEGGHELMALVSGMGCAVGGMLAAWLSVEATYSSAAATLALVGNCGFEAAGRVNGPGSFVAAWLDEIYTTGR